MCDPLRFLFYSITLQRLEEEVTTTKDSLLASSKTYCILEIHPNKSEP
jgi:hypothetical protein